MYNEDDILFGRTMSGVFKNVEYLCSRKDSKTWGPDAWKKNIVCAAMAVQRLTLEQRRFSLVTAHIYEYTAQTGISVKGGVVTLRPVMESEAANFDIRQMTFVPMPVLRHLRLYSNSIHLMYLVVVSTPCEHYRLNSQTLIQCHTPFQKNCISLNIFIVPPDDAATGRHRIAMAIAGRPTPCCEECATAWHACTDY
jgi:hypothetical protein